MFILATDKNKMISTAVTQISKYMNKQCKVNQVTGSCTIQISTICKVNVFSLSIIRREAAKECGERSCSHYNQKSGNLNYYSPC